MKKLIIMALFLVSGIYASADNIAVNEGLKVKPGEKGYVELVLDKSVTCSSLGMDITLPKGLEFAKDGEGDLDIQLPDGISDSNVYLDGNILENGALRVGIISKVKNVNLSDAIVKIGVKAGSEASGKYGITIASSQFVTEELTKTTAASQTINETIEVNVATAIGHIADVTSDAVYDLGGRKVNAARKGIYIIGGKKVSVK